MARASVQELCATVHNACVQVQRCLGPSSDRSQIFKLQTPLQFKKTPPFATDKGELKNYMYLSWSSIFNIDISSDLQQ